MNIKNCVANTKLRNWVKFTENFTKAQLTQGTRHLVLI